MTISSEFAPAKINLTLEVFGRRADGYHELRSLVAFAADAGDKVSLKRGAAVPTVVTGPFGGALHGPNLVDSTLAAVRHATPDLPPLAAALEKNVPVASGIGGGSADAAAVLRLMRRNYPEAAAIDIGGIARALGSDVAVCLHSRASVMTGKGDVLAPFALPRVFAVLAYAPADVRREKTARVFRELGAPMLNGDIAPSPAMPQFAEFEELAGYLAEHGNDLEAPARRCFPVIGTVLEALRADPACRLARQSGAGPACFALCGDRASADAAAVRLKERHPDWWITPTRLV